MSRRPDGAPTLAEIIQDPIVLALMNCWSVKPEEVLQLLESVRRKMGEKRIAELTAA